MAIVTTDNQHYSDIAAAIRAKNGTDTQYTPAEMAAAIQAISGGGEGMAFVAQTASADWESTQEVSLSISTVPKALVLAVVMHRYSIETPDGWNLLFCGADIEESGFQYIQQVSVFAKESESYSEGFNTNISSSGRSSIIMFTILNNSKIVNISDVFYENVGVSGSFFNYKKEKNSLFLTVVHRLSASSNENYIKLNPDLLKIVITNRLYCVIDSGPILNYKASVEDLTVSTKTAYFSIIIPKAEEEIDYDFSGFESNAVNPYEAAKAVKILLGRE